jgi:hypothetical protein
MSNATDQKEYLTDHSPKALRAGVWFSGIGGLMLPLALWGIMVSAMPLLGPSLGLKVRVVAENFLTMAWPTSVVLIAPDLGLWIIVALLLVNMATWGAIGFVSQTLLLRPFAYYGLLVMVIFGLLISNGYFIWMSISRARPVFDLIDIPTVLVAAVGISATFVLIRRHALRRVP